MHIKHTASVLLFAATLAACTKDLGNYSYHDVNTGVVTLPAQVSAVIGDTVTIVPEIKFSQDPGDGSDTSRYSYEWTVVNTNGSLRVFATTRNINQPMNMLGVGTYSAGFRIKDKTTGVAFQSQFSLLVSTAAYEGLFVFGNVADSSRLDMLAYNGTSLASEKMYRDVLTAFETDYPRPIGKALNVYGIAKNTQDYLLLISTTKGTNRLDRNTLKWDITKNISYLCYGDVPQGFAPSMMWGGVSYMLMYEKNNIYFWLTNLLFNLGAPVNRIAAEPASFKASEWYCQPGTNNGSIAIFDMDKRRFVRYIFRTTVYDKYSSTYVNPTPALFDYNNLKADLVWVNRVALNNNAYAILKTDAGEYRMAVFNPASAAQVAYKLMPSFPALAQATQFVLDPKFTTLYFSAGSKLYAYYLDANSFRELQDFGKPVTYLGFPVTNGGIYSTDFQNRLAVGTFDATNASGGGTLQFFQTFGQGATPQITEGRKITGFGEIKAVYFRSRAGGV
ncbi:PKD-like family lipoprotein [Chitinophaga lutea]